MIIESLLKAAASAKSLSEFIEGGGVADVIAEINLVAAKISLEKIKFAKKPREQVLILLSQLEIALAAVTNQFTTSLGLKTGDVRMMGRGHNLLGQYRMICCLMALCYMYLDEVGLCRKQFETAMNPPDRQGTALEVVGFLSLSLTGLPQLLGHRLYGLVKRDEEYFDRVMVERILGGGRDGVSNDEVHQLQSILLGEDDNAEKR